MDHVSRHGFNSLPHGKFFMLNCCLLIFFQNQLFRKKNSGIPLSNRLDPDQAQHFVGSDLGPNCLQKLSADDTGMFKFSKRQKLCNPESLS